MKVVALLILTLVSIDGIFFAQQAPPEGHMDGL